MKSRLIIILLMLSFGSQAQNIEDPLEADSTIRQSFIHIGVGAQSKRTNIDLGIGWRNKNVLIIPGIVGSIYHLTGTDAYEYSAQVKFNTQYHFLNYGFLNSWTSCGKQYRWTPYVQMGVSAGTRYIQNHHLIIYDLDKWNFLMELNVSAGVKYSPKDILGWHTNGYLTFMGAVGMVNSNLDQQYLNLSVGISYNIGY